MTIDQLENIVKDAATAYYSGQPIMSDNQFDRYVDWLRAVKPDSSVLITGWGYNPEEASGDKVTHIHGGMGSIDRKPRDMNSIPANLRNNVRISAKLDGLSGKLEFVNGEFVSCSTRGNGEVGILKTDKFIPLLRRYGGTRLPSNFTGEVRGEFVISQDSWNKLLQKGTAKKNARNTASGIINCDGIPEDIDYLDFVPYKIIWDPHSVFSTTLIDDMGDCEFCKYFPGFPQLPKILKSDTYTQEELVDMYNGWGLLYPVDGVVITSNNANRNERGEFEYDEVAFKFETLRKVTRLKSIDWQMSKQSLLIPVGNLEPVDIDGATVSRVTLHNAALVKSLEIQPGCELDIMRSGGVIPKLMEVVSYPKSVNTFSLPESCPVCGSKLIMSGVHLKCSNEACGNIDKSMLKTWFQFIGRVDGVAETTAFSYFDRFKIGCIEDVYRTNLKYWNALRVEGITASKFADVMCSFIEGKHSLSNSLQALNIPRLGEVTSRKLCEDSSFVSSAGEFLEDINNSAKLDKLLSGIHRVAGDATYDSVCKNKNRFIKYWSFIKDNIIIPNVSESKQYAGAVCITGKLSMPRKQFEDILRSAGFIIKSEVTKNVNYLVTNEYSGTSSKHKQADKLGIKKLTEQEILDLCK